MVQSKETNARILAGECFCRAVRYAVVNEFAYALKLPLLELPAHDGFGVQAVRRHRAREIQRHARE
jgi:hypothetical protein